MSITLSKQTSVYRQVDAILKRKIYTAETSNICVVCLRKRKSNFTIESLIVAVITRKIYGNCMQKI